MPPSSKPEWDPENVLSKASRLHPSTRHVGLTLLRPGLALALTLLGTLTPILVRASRTVEGDSYAPEQVVCCAEACKAVLAGVGVLMGRRSKRGDAGRPRSPAHRMLTAAKIGALALVYAAHNNLLIATLRAVDLATFQVMFSWRIPATALALHVVMRKHFTRTQKAALALLMAGTMLTQWGGGRDRPHLALSFDGLAMVCLLVSTSSLACVLNEAMLKDDSQGSLHAQNLQLYAFGFLINAGAAAWAHGGVGWMPGLRVWSALTWTTIASMSLLGIATSATIKYADNIVRAFAAAGSIVVAALVSWAWFGQSMGGLFVLGSAVTCGAVGLYYL